MTDLWLKAELPAELVEEIVTEVTRRVLAAVGQPGPVSHLMTVPEAAELLRCSRQRIDDLLSSRRLTRVKEGGRTLVLRLEIEKHLDKQPRRST